MGKIYDKFNERIAGVDFTEEEQLKIVFQLVKNNDYRTCYNNGSYEQFGIHARSKENDASFLLQVTWFKEPEYRRKFEILITGGGSDRNHLGSERFNELFQLF